MRALAQAVTEDAVAELYAALLAGRRAVSLRGLVSPLPPAALAALLLPLPREIADAISIAGWLPASGLSPAAREEVQVKWDLVLGGVDGAQSTGAEPVADQIRRAREMAARLFADAPDPGASAATTKSFHIALWGPSSAGKTALIAQLFLERETDENWEVLPTEQSLAFIKKMRARMHTNNQFPAATAVGDVERIEYDFTHRRQENVSARIHLEDRSGKDSENLLEVEKNGRLSLRDRLRSADGMVLVFDPLADVAILNARISDALDLLHVDSGRGSRKDARPIAVCFSKADGMIKTPQDLRRALHSPDEFVRDHMDPRLMSSLDRLCSNYRLFPVSAAGVRLGHGAIEPVVFIDESLRARLCPGGRPFNLMAPFSWVLDQLMEIA